LIGGPVSVIPDSPATGYPSDFSASVQVTYSTGGDHQLTAKYSGDANYAASVSSPLTIHPLYPTTMMVTQSATNVNYGQSVTVTASVISSYKSPAMGGHINFLVNGSQVAAGPTTLSVDTSGNQVLTSVLTFSPQGNVQVQAVYPSDGNFESASTATAVNVNIPDFTLGPTGLSVIPVAGQPASGQITITPVSQTPSAVTLSMSPFVISGYTVGLTPQQVNLNGAPTTAALTLTPVVTVSANAIKSQERRASFFAIPRNSWWLQSLGSPLCAVFVILFLLRVPGSTRRYRPVLGFCVIYLVSYLLGCGGAGTSSTPVAGGGGQSAPGPTSITLTTSNAKVAAGAPLIITATITSTRTLTGTVTFYNFGTAIAGGFPPVNGQAQTGQGYINNPGIYQITASYSGDSSNLASTSAPLIQVLTGTLPVTVVGATGADTHSVQAIVGLQ
jgi:hypothetical protein